MDKSRGVVRWLVGPASVVMGLLIALLIALLVASCSAPESESAPRTDTRSPSTEVADYFGDWANADAEFSICDYKFEGIHFPRNVTYVNENGSAPVGHMKPDRADLVNVRGQVLSTTFGPDGDLEGVQLTVFVSAVDPETPQMPPNFDLFALGKGRTATLSLHYGDPESVSVFTFHRSSSTCPASSSADTDGGQG